MEIQADIEVESQSKNFYSPQEILTRCFAVPGHKIAHGDHKHRNANRTPHEEKDFTKQAFSAGSIDEKFQDMHRYNHKHGKTLQQIRQRQTFQSRNFSFVKASG